MTKKRTNASATQVIAVHARLTAVIEKLPDGMCQYTDPALSDVAMAAELGVSLSTIGRIRTEMFGKLKRSPMGSEFLADIQGLKVQLAELTDKHNKLVVTLALKQVAEVKHLAVGNGAAAVLKQEAARGA